ncbi:hypothetical protein IW262DRAFT_1013548 [Armillaria fumosa]|nr:hypothetical protein IW262DRAFT_1013548 [Armillaria fumosa]
MDTESSDDETGKSRKGWEVCTCRAFRCCDKTNPENGQPGHLLPPHTFRKHEMREERYAIREIAQRKVEEQSGAVERDQRLHAQLLDSHLLPSSPQTSIPKRRNVASPTSLSDARNNCIQLFGSIKDAADDLKGTLVDMPNPDALGQVELLASVRLLDGYEHEYNSLFRKAEMLSKQKAAKVIKEQVYDLMTVQLSDCSRRIHQAKLQYDQAVKEKSMPPSYIPTCDTARHYVEILGGANPILVLVQYMVVVCNVILTFSRRGCSWLFDICRIIVDETMDHTLLGHPVRRTQTDDNIINKFPRDVPTSVHHFNLESDYVVYAACPRCNHVYQPSWSDPRSPYPVYPKECRYRRYNRGKPCNTPLLRPTSNAGVVRNVPLKPFLSFNFNDWLGGLLSRPGYEKDMDASWEGVTEPQSTLKDIFDGSLVRNFMGLDGKTHFSVPSETGRKEDICWCPNLGMLQSTRLRTLQARKPFLGWDYSRPKGTFAGQDQFLLCPSRRILPTALVDRSVVHEDVCLSTRSTRACSSDRSHLRSPGCKENWWIFVLQSPTFLHSVLVS